MGARLPWVGIAGLAVVVDLAEAVVLGLQVLIQELDLFLSLASPPGLSLPGLSAPGLSSRELFSPPASSSPPPPSFSSLLCTSW